MIKINSVNITIKGREETLTLEEAEELHFALDKLFEKKFDYPPTYVPPPYQPYYRDQWWNVPDPNNPPAIYCSDTLTFSIT